MTLFVLLFLVVAIAIVMLVVNWIWLVVVNRDMQQKNDALAYAGAFELLDNNVLLDLAFAQADDVVDASTAVDTYRTANNNATAPFLRLESTDITVTAGVVSDVTAPAFTTVGSPLNTLRVEIKRFTTGTNPVQTVMRGLGGPSAVDVSTASYVTLDSRLTGFRPTTAALAPVVPLGVETTAWFTTRVIGASDSNANSRFEMDVVLLSSTGTGAANGALFDFDQAGGIDFGRMPAQITAGIPATHLPVSGLLGPATVGTPLATAGTQTSTNTATIVAAFNTVAASTNIKRVFPIYADPFLSPDDIIGFIGADILSASDIGVFPATRISVTIEPQFIVHTTATTDPAEAENFYVHKLRLVQ